MTLVDKTPEAARALISNMAANSQQFNTHSEAPQKVNEVTIPSNLDQKNTDLTASQSSGYLQRLLHNRPSIQLMSGLTNW